MKVAVVGTVVIGGEDEAEEAFLPHITGDVVKDFGLRAVEARRETTHSPTSFPGGAVVPGLCNVVFCATGFIECTEIDGSTKAVIA